MIQSLFSFSDRSSAPPSEQERMDWLRLIRTENIGPVTFHQLLDTYGSAGEALRILPELAKRGGRKKTLTPPSPRAIENELKALHKMGGTLLLACDENYPLALSAIDDAPPVLSALGNTALANQSCIGIVGARNASITGRKIAETLAQDLGTRNQIIVSGLARGIDTAAHQGALQSGTISVVAGGINIVYPEENQKLYEHIIASGLILAESPFGQKPFAASFPRRNRIVSGLSKSVIVIEATFRSGSLITARLAGEQGRDVMAVPGSPLDPRAQGPNHLIREGATLIRSADDVMEAFTTFTPPAPTIREPSPPSFTSAPTTPPDNAQEIILSQLSQTPVTIDELIRACGLDTSHIHTTLLELDLAGRIQRLPGGRVSLL